MHPESRGARLRDIHGCFCYNTFAAVLVVRVLLLWEDIDITYQVLVQSFD
jgi:hypothetical protein